MRTVLIGATVAALALSVAAHAQPAQSSPPKAPARQCFWVNDIDNYSVNANEDVIYLRIRNHDVWRLDLYSSCSGLSYKQALPIRTFGGARSVCGAIDLDIKVSDHGIAIPCSVRELHKLSPEEIAAIPKRDRP